jgi:pimeloyl-ACP methyl ester carboxylesterase
MAHLPALRGCAGTHQGMGLTATISTASTGLHLLKHGMAIFERTTDDGLVRLNYEVTGNGPPILLIAPGGLRSTLGVWANMPWNPISALADTHTVIAMDQRNAGDSFGPLLGHHGWETYTADQLALLDHLQIDTFAIAGMCIGGPYIMGLIAAAPERVIRAVMLQPIGVDDNRQVFSDLVRGWKDEIGHLHPETSDAAWDQFGHNMFGGDFMYNTSLDDIAGCPTPLIVLMGNDIYHPESISRAVAQHAPNVEFIESWKEGEALAAADLAIKSFLAQ